MPIKIRLYLKSAEVALQGIIDLSETFYAYDIEWSELKNKEDFREVFKMPNDQRALFEDLYSTGRSVAGYMAGHLLNFNDAAQFPRISDWVESFKKNWCSEENLETLVNRLSEYRVGAAAPGTPWAVLTMIQRFDDQIQKLKIVNQHLEICKTADIYRIEKGELTLKEVNERPVVDQSVNIEANKFHLTAGRDMKGISILSTDNSQSHTQKENPITKILKWVWNGLCQCMSLKGP